MKYETRVTRFTVAPIKEPIFSERATHLQIEDDAAGEFIAITQNCETLDPEKRITIDPDEWPEIKKAIETLLADCREYQIED
jgi:hypothetical protein